MTDLSALKELAKKATPAEKTGWPPGMLQDDDRKLSQWLASRIDSRMHAREAAQAIEAERSALADLEGAGKWALRIPVLKGA